uniref:Neurite outgrowth-associated protein n=1 Tax=Anopheles atroparvus TaxID=41427 RepID=A0AAG5CZ92_ANOAO
MLRSMLKTAYNKQKLLCRYYVWKARNPGIDRRAALLPEDAKVEEYESLDDSEPDFHQVHKSHKQYEAEQAQYRDRLQTWIVGNKYFKSKQLNFLTWSEKEQIRYLHAFDPEEWSIDKLTESFPADRYTVAKIVKTKWQPKDNKRMERHDAAVKENWLMFRSGRIQNIDPGFAQHLNKFVQRNVAKAGELEMKMGSKRLYEIRPLPEGEFSAIVTSCKKYQTKEKATDSQQDLLLGDGEQLERNELLLSPDAPKQDTFLMGEIKHTQHITMSEMKKRESIDSNDCIKLDADYEGLELGTEIMDKLANITAKNNSTVLADSSYDARAKTKEGIREFIRVPKKLYKKGATYQLDDCFYDDDGEFLYRVPGMTRIKK